MDKPTNEKEMTAFLKTLNLTDRTRVNDVLIEHGWATNREEAEALMNACGWFVTATSEDGWEPGIT